MGAHSEVLGLDDTLLLVAKEKKHEAACNQILVEQVGRNSAKRAVMPSANVG